MERHSYREDAGRSGRSASARRALLLKFGQIGDVVMAIPAAYALHKQGYEIDWACGRAVEPLLSCHSWIRSIAVDEKAIFSGSPLRRLRAIANLWMTLGRDRYDLCATLYYDRRYRLLTLPVRAARKRMLSRSSRGTSLLTGRHHTDEFVRFLLEQPDSCRDHSTEPVRPDRLPSSPLPPQTAARRIAIVPGAAGNMLRQLLLGHQPQALRRWPIEHFVALSRLLIERDWEVILLGGPDEAWAKPYFNELPVTDRIGALTLPEVVAACAECDAVISNDTGPLHLAGMTDTCLIGLFGPTDPAMLLPRRPYSVAIWGGNGFACRPCYDGREFAPCEHNGCMDQITVDLVLRELDHLLQARSEGEERPWRIVAPVPIQTGTKLVELRPSSAPPLLG